MEHNRTIIKSDSHFLLEASEPELCEDLVGWSRYITNFHKDAFFIDYNWEVDVYLFESTC
jgi:hypothetical protein